MNRQWISGNKSGVPALELCPASMPSSSSEFMVVEVYSAALNFSDLLMIEDKYQVKPERPFTPGQEIAGIVIDVPDNCRWKKGDRIASKVVWGGFANYVSVQPDMAIAVPENIGFQEAVCLPVVYMTAMVALFSCSKTGPQDTVLVHAAAGGVGLASVELAKCAGAKVIATAGNQQKLELAQKHGADIIINYRDEDWVAQVKKATNNLGATIIVDPVGGEIANQSLRCIARDGTLLIVGFASGSIPKLPANRLLLKRASAKGVIWSHEEDGPMLQKFANQLAQYLSNGRIKPVYNDSFSFEQLPLALEHLSSRGSVGKVILTVKSEPKNRDPQ